MRRPLPFFSLSLSLSPFRRAYMVTDVVSPFPLFFFFFLKKKYSLLFSDMVEKGMKKKKLKARYLKKRRVRKGREEKKEKGGAVHFLSFFFLVCVRL